MYIVWVRYTTDKLEHNSYNTRHQSLEVCDKVGGFQTDMWFAQRQWMGG